MKDTNRLRPLAWGRGAEARRRRSRGKRKEGRPRNGTGNSDSSREGGGQEALSLSHKTVVFGC